MPGKWVGSFIRGKNHEEYMAKSKFFHSKAFRAKKMKLSKKLGKMSRDLYRMCRHLKNYHS